ncbi:MAG: aminoacetone oxidase family FAD-binding enzyme [Clostridia bacterium]|nr:aminoacetone oxidase family FAD-binding enzyme [Clostridia bacterium]
MKTITTAIIGGGAAGLIVATALKNSKNTILFERGERLGRKLSATGNGQGNLTNLAALQTDYFSVCGFGEKQAKNILRTYDQNSFCQYLRALGVLTFADERGRVYPTGRQASSITDALRFCVAARGIDVRLSAQVVDIKPSGDGFILTVKTTEGEERYFAKNVALCVGGKAAKNFGTDGTAYALAEKLGHSVTALYPSLVQLKTQTTYIKTLKGLRVNDGGLTAFVGGENICSLRGDVIFTDYGVSGDAVFRISAFLTNKIGRENVQLQIDFLPEFTEDTVLATLQEKRASFPDLPTQELLCGIVNNQIGRTILKRADGDLKKAAAFTKAFPLEVTGSLGFDYAQVTKGGVPMSEVDEILQSKLQNGLYFAGEILDVDGQCGGFNLQWAYSSARTIATALDEKILKGGGQV